MGSTGHKMRASLTWVATICTLFTLAFSCAPECAVTFCDGSTSLSLARPDSAVKRLCLEGKPLANVQSGPSAVLVNGRKIPLSDFNPSGLSQSFSPTFFKLYSSSSIGHESVQGNQDQAILGTCVIVPILGAPFSSCVSFLVVQAAGPHSSPTPTATATSALLGPTVSSSETPGKRFPSPTAQGSGTLVPEPSASVPSRFTRAPTPVAAASPLPPRASSFVDVTFSRGSAKDEYVLPSATQPEKDSYRVVYDIETIGAGVVSLTNVAPEVESVQCLPPDKVLIRMRTPVWGASLAQSYPVGAILVVDGSLYGNCAMLNPDAKGTRFEGRLGLRRENAYLKIVAVSGSSMEYTIKVQPASFLALFERASIEVRRENATSVSTLVRKAPNTAESAGNGKVGPGVLKPLSGTEEISFSKSFFEYTASYQFINNGQFDLFKFERSLTNVEVEMQLIEDYAILEKQTFTLKPGQVSKSDAVTFASFPIFGIPKVSFAKLSKNLPPLDLGIYAELDLFYEVNIDLPTKLSVTTSKRYNSGRRRVIMTARGNVPFITPRVKVVKEKAPSQTNEKPVIAAPLLDEEKLTLASLTVGLRPSIAAYISYLKAAVSIDLGLTLSLDAVAPFRPAFPPITKVQLTKHLAGVKGVCETCHRAQVKMDAVVKDPKAEVLFVGKDPFLEIPFSDGSPLLSYPISLHCFLKEFGERTQTCGRVCCDMDVGPCEFKAELKEPTCRGTPTPLPAPDANATSSPVPTAEPARKRPVVYARTYTDPHLVTFDGVRYSCQGVGEFVLVQAAGSGLKIQARFHGNVTGKSASVTTALAVTATNMPTVQIAVPNDGKRDGLSCPPPEVYWNGELRNVDTLPTTGKVIVSVVRGSVSVDLSSEQLTVGLGAEDAADKTTRGLLGSPDGNLANDWMDRTGKTIKVADGLRRVQKEAYSYCTKNWCIRDAKDSLFTYAAGDSYAARNDCDAPYVDIDLSAASPELRRICNGNIACLIDGLATNSLEEARRTIGVEEELEKLVRGNESASLRSATSGNLFTDPIDLGDTRVGSVVTFSKSMAIGRRSSLKEDVYLITDATTSMSGVINTVRTQFEEIVKARAAASTDVAFGVGAFGDETYNSEGYRNGFRNVISMTKNLTAVRAGVSSLRTAGSPLGDLNVDYPEGGLVALYEIATSPAIKWRSDSRKIVAYMADNSQHEPSCVNGLVIRRENVVAALKRKGIAVLMIDIPTRLFGLSAANEFPTAFNCTDEISAPQNQALNISESTNGAYLLSPSSDEVVEVLNAGIENLNLTITADTSDCDAKYGVEFSPQLPIVVGSISSLTLQVTVSVKEGACNSTPPKCAAKLLASEGLLAEQSVLAKSILGC